MLAISGIEHRVKCWPAQVGEAMAGAGLLLILVGFIQLSPATPWPSYNALLPVAGAVLLIASPSTTAVSRLLSLRPVVYVGLISYCLYLWHWPVNVILQTQTLLSAPVLAAVVVAVTFLLAVVSRYCIERPSHRYASQPASAIVSVSAVMLVCLSAGIFWKATRDNNASHLSPSAKAMASWLDYKNSEASARQFRKGVCFVNLGNTAHEEYQDDKCLAYPSANQPVLLMGDSHAAHLWRALSEAMPSGTSLLETTASGCKPFVTQGATGRCEKLMNKTFSTRLEHLAPASVILAARWSPHDREQLLKTLAFLHKKHIRALVLGPSPEFTAPLPALLAKRIQNKQPDTVALTPGIQRLDREMKSYVTGAGASYLSLYDSLCSQTRCTVVTEAGEPMMFDDNHFTLAGAQQAVQQMQPAMRGYYHDLQQSVAGADKDPEYADPLHDPVATTRATSGP